VQVFKEDFFAQEKKTCKNFATGKIRTRVIFLVQVL